MVSWEDYASFTAMLVLSALIGIYFGCFGSKQKNAEEYLMGKRKMKIIPVAISATVSQFSAVTLLGVPADVYKWGATYCLACVSLLLVVIANNYVFMPVFYKLKTTSIYDYLELRFDNKVKLFASFLYVVASTLYLPLIVYGPSLAFSAAIGVDIHLVCFIVSTVCIFYTAIGGLKAVIWTDFIQFISIICSLLSVFIVSVNSMEGFGSFWSLAKERQRLDIDFDIDPTKRESFWTVVIGFTIITIGRVCIHQCGVQKFLALPSLRASKLSAKFFGVMWSLVIIFCVTIGLGMFGRYANCDPVINKQIKNYDQMVPYFLIDVAKDVPGILGLFLAALLSAGISTMSGTLNALSAVIYTAFLKNSLRNSTERRVSRVLKLTVVFNGAICTVLALFVDRIKEGIFPLALTLTSATVAPLLGVFTLGVLFPRANAKGGFYGMIIGFIFMVLLIVPQKYYQIRGVLKETYKPFSVSGCNQTDISVLGNLTESIFNKTLPNNLEPPLFIFRISFYYFTLVGTTMTIIFGLVISYMTKKNSSRTNKNLISPIIYFLLPKDKTNREGCNYSSVETL